MRYLNENIIYDFIEKITLLEKKVGNKTTHKILDPFPVNTQDIIDVQKAARIIADFVGLKFTTIVVVYAKQKENSSGSIRLDKNHEEVFIEISENAKNFPSSLLAIIAHEISHKYLQINELSFSNNYENEIFTDLTTVYLGLGKLSLNGCYNFKKKEENKIGGVEITTTTFETGYLKRIQFVFIYKFICSIRKIDKGFYEYVLNQDVITELKEIEKDYNMFFDYNLHFENNKNKILTLLEKKINKSKKNLSNIQKTVNYLKNGIVKQLEVYVENSHKKILNYENELSTLTSGNTNPSLKYINNLKLLLKYRIINREIYTTDINENIVIADLDLLWNVSKSFQNPLLKPSFELVQYINCPNCKMKLKIKSSKLEKISCPHCNYKFLFNTIIDFKNFILLYFSNFFLKRYCNFRKKLPFKEKLNKL